MSKAADSAADFYVRFWGVRGSIACPGNKTVKYGGETSCIEVRYGGKLLIFDGGTGLRNLGKDLLTHGPVEGDIFFSHAHLDHIGGVPFFTPIYDSQNIFRLWAGHLLPGHTLEEVLRHLMTSPLFPVPPDIFSKGVSYHDFKGGETLDLNPGLVLKTAVLNHPNGATGYRVEYGGHSVCYITDTEHYSDKLDENILGLIEGADLMIYDCTFTDEEYQNYKGWGHSTWQEGARLCEAAGVKKFVVFHHDPSHDDDFMDKLSAEITKVSPNSVVAREGMVLYPGKE